MYKKIMVFGMVILIMLCTPLPSFAASDFSPFTRTYLYSSDDSRGQLTSQKYKELSSYHTVLKDNENGRIFAFQTDYPLVVDSSLSFRSVNAFYFSSQFNQIRGVLEYFYVNPISGIDYTYSLNRHSVLWSDYNILKSDGSLYFSNSNINVSTEFEAKILTPWHDDYKDNGKTFAFQGMFRLPSDVQRSDVRITGTINDSKDSYWINEQWRESYVTNTGSPNVKPYFSFNFALTVYDYGIYTYKLVFEQVSTGKKLGEVTRRFESLEGFIDENGDGLDDRTNQPPYTPLDPPGTNPATSPEWDGTILGFFQYLIDSVKYYVQNIVDGINVTMGAIGKVPQIMGTILNFPEPLTALLIFGVTCTIILAIFRR